MSNEQDKSATILVVDDNEDNRDMLVRRLEREGYRAITAINGRQALEVLRARQGSLDLLLLDIMMPIMDGYQVLEQMKADPALARVPVIVITALDEMENAVRCIELGAEDVLPKPFSQVLLQARINASLEKKRLRDLEQSHLQEMTRLNQALQAANEAKSRFLRFTAHELRNPITGIRGHAQLLLGGMLGPLTAQQSAMLERIRLGTLRLAVLASDLSDISEIEAGRLTLRCAAVGLHDVVLEVVGSLEEQARDKQIEMTIEVAPDLPPVHADRVRLMQVLTNLVSNGCKYTPAGGRILIRAEPVRAAGRGGALHVSVQDTGIGISEQDRLRVFEEFFRSDDGLAREAPGMGLGLAITKRLVEMQGGQIWFESELRHGTTFHLELPLWEETGAQPQ